MTWYRRIYLMIVVRYAFTIIANVLVFGCFWGLLERINNGATGSDSLNVHDKQIFWIMALVVIGVGLPITLMFQFIIREDPSHDQHRLKWYKWLANPKFYLTACSLVAARFIVLLPQSFMPSYFITTLCMDKTSIAKGPLILFLSSFVSTFIVKQLSKKLGDKMTYFLGLAVVWGALIWFWMKDPLESIVTTSHCDFNLRRDYIYGATILLGAGGATVLVISLSMISHLVGNYKGSSGFVYGWMLFTDRLTNGVAVKVITSFQPPKDSSSLPDYHRNVLIYPAFAGSALGLLTIALLLLIEWRNKKKEVVVIEPDAESEPDPTAPINSTSRHLLITSSANYGTVAGVVGVDSKPSGDL